jgi:hypothetical protein
MVTFRGDIQVAKGGFLAVLVSGRLTVAGNVTQLDGFYLAEGGVQIDDGSNQLVVNGAMVSLSSGVTILRDLGSSAQPVVVFSYRPDLLLNLPKELKKRRFVKQELLP